MPNDDINKRALICQAGDILTILNAMSEILDSTQELGQKFLMGSMVASDFEQHLQAVQRTCQTVHAISADIRHRNFPDEDGTTEADT